MKKDIKTSNPINTMDMDDLLKPLESVKEVNPPFFLRDKINARLYRAAENITPRAAIWACASLALLCAMTFYAADTTRSASATTTGIDLMPHNDLYGQP